MTGRGQRQTGHSHEGSTADRRSPSVRRRERASRQRIRRVHVRLSEQEFAAIARAATSLGRTPAGFTAEAALAASGGASQPRFDPMRDVVLELMAARAQLRRYGNNVNQAARVLNAGGRPPDWLQVAIGATHRAVERIDRAIADLTAHHH